MMRSLLHFLYKRAENMQVALMVIMFVAFIVQISTRYVFNAPVNWAFEVILDTWLWSVFWGAAFLLSDKDHVKFDVLYHMGGESTRRILALVSAAALIVFFSISVPSTWSYVSFKGIRSSEMLHIPMDILFSAYLVFLLAMIAHYIMRTIRLLRGDSLTTLEREESL
jgi:C4-dicarboxylate transporter, DctQ subunit